VTLALKLFHNEQNAILFVKKLTVQVASVQFASLYVTVIKR